MNRTAATGARAALLSTLLIGWACAGGAAPQAPDATEEFRKTLKEVLSVKAAEPHEGLAPRIDWQRLENEVVKAPTVQERRRRQALVDLWKTLAALHDRGRECARPCVFERDVRLLLKGDKRPVRELRGVVKLATGRGDLPFDPTRFRRYLMAGELPEWARSVRYVAAGVLAGEGNREGMELLVEGVHLSRRPGARATGLHAWHLMEATPGAQTEKALPLWKKVLTHKDESVRSWAITRIAQINSPKATTLLIASLRDSTYPVRKSAALILMTRDSPECVPVLREILERELRDHAQAAWTMAPICMKLAQWKVEGVPWAVIEKQLNEEATKESHTHWRAINIAGHCLSVGRQKAAVPFLQKAMADTHEQVALHAARTLLRNGRGLGMERLARHMATMKPNWSEAYNDLRALAAFLSHRTFTADEFAAAMDVSRTAYQRRKPIFQGYQYRLFEALGEMGALCRVKRVREAATPAVFELIEVPYDVADRGLSGVTIAAIHKGKLRSIAVSAQQQGITLTDEWLANLRRAEIAAIAKLAAQGSADLAKRAAKALKTIRGRSKG